MLLATALSDLSFLQIWFLQWQKRAIQDLDFFSWSLNNPWWSISIQTISFSSRINQNTSAWFSDGISVPREIKGYNMLSSRFQRHQPAWTNTAAFLQMCWKSTFETACNSATRWLTEMCINFNMAKSEINTYKPKCQVSKRLTTCTSLGLHFSTHLPCLTKTKLWYLLLSYSVVM